MTRDNLISAVRAALDPTMAGYVIHVHPKTYNPELIPIRCPFCNSDAGVLRRQLTIEERAVDAITCPGCQHCSVYSNGPVSS